jgi:hypothetical protein
MNLAPKEIVTGAETATTVNISPHGARLVTKRHWEPGEQSRIAPTSDKFHAQAKVVYCQMISQGRFCIGLELRPEFAKQWTEFFSDRLLQDLKNAR